MKTTDEKPRPKRLLALDILRGMTIAGMLLVNNPGSWGSIYAPLRHAEWNGLTPTDLVFPFFMFIMGLSTYFSMQRYQFRLSWQSGAKILRRSVILFLIGMAIAWLALFLRGISGGAELADAIFNFDHIRILGVIPRLAICYGIGTLLALVISRKALPWTVAGLLVIYGIILLFGHGFEFSEKSVLYIVDNAILGPSHLYSDNVGGVSLHLDPEGLLSTLPSIAHMLIGFLCGQMIMNTKDNSLRINKLFILGTILTFSGFLLDYGMPINKKIWSPTFVLSTCGLASSFLGLLIWIIDIRGHKKWCRFFEAFGVNPLFMYVTGTVASLLISFIKVPCQTAESGMTSLHTWLYKDVLVPACFDDKTLASLVFAMLFVAFIWCIGYILYRKKIYIKI